MKLNYLFHALAISADLQNRVKPDKLIVTSKERGRERDRDAWECGGCLETASAGVLLSGIKPFSPLFTFTLEPAPKRKSRTANTFCYAAALHNCTGKRCPSLSFPPSYWLIYDQPKECHHTRNSHSFYTEAHWAASKWGYRYWSTGIKRYQEATVIPILTSYRLADSRFTACACAGACYSWAVLSVHSRP